MTSNNTYDKFVKVYYETISVQVFFRFREVATVRVGVTLACTECKRRNYTTNKNKKNDPNRIELKKYCKWCHTHTTHKETR